MVIAFKELTSRAEIQKAYRERKKANEGEAFRKWENSRVKKYYFNNDAKLPNTWTTESD